MSINRSIVCGRLTADIEVRETPSGIQVTHFYIAVNSGTKENPKADFIRCVAWGKTAAFLGQYFSKGRKLIAEGSLRSYQYESEGRNIKGMELLVKNVDFADSKGKTNADNTESDTGADEETLSEMIFGGAIPDEEIPF